MKKLLSYILTPIHLLAFGLSLLVFHAVQVVALNLGGYSWHKKSVDFLNYFLMRSLIFLGTWVRFENSYKLPTDRPLIIVANHQSLHDIPPFFWFLRKHHVKFVAKKELEYGFPSISYNLRNGGSVCIDRKDRTQAIVAMRDFGKYIEENNYSAVIFPEGTRSRKGKPKEFQRGGLVTLMQYTPSALIVPVVINDAWKLQLGFPMQVGVKATWKVLPPIDPVGRSADEVVSEVEDLIISQITYKSAEAEKVKA